MKKLTTILAMMLCASAIGFLVSCSDDDDDENVNYGTVENLVGEWTCTWSKAINDESVQLQENAYVGSTWKFGTGKEYDDMKFIGEFAVAVNGEYNENVTGEYHYYDEDQYSAPRLLVWISEYNEFSYFQGFHENKSGDAVRTEGDYMVTVSDNIMTLYQYENSDGTISDETILLKFSKVE